ncbi:MAG: hypothetical protein GX591_02265 [Planctomycetes bacterium]|nr:hypothetical protein [Planctomycetota bacterium]
MTTRSILANVTAVAVILTALAAPVAADTHTWVGLGDGTSWHDPANWSPAELPLEIGTGDGADAVVIDGAHDVVIGTDVVAVNSVKIDGDATLTIASGRRLNTNNLDIVNGGLIFEEIDGTGASLGWGKANRGHLFIEAQGYITGAGAIRTTTGGGGVQIRSQRAADFDMTRITLQLAYGEDLVVASADLGRDNLPAWDGGNFALGTLQLADRRFSHALSGTPNVHALYCRELRFAGSSTESADLDMNGLNVYVLNKIVWADGTYTDTPGELPVATAHVDLERWTSLWDDSADPGQAFVGQGISPNDPPVADAGDDQSVIDADGDGFEDVQLDGTGSTDLQGPIAAYDWTEGGSPLAAGATPTVHLAVGEHTLTLTVTDADDATDDDTVVVTVQPQAALFPPTAEAGPDQDLTDLDDDGFETVSLDGSASSDSDGSVVNWVWTEGGMIVATGETATAILPAGVNVVTLTVTDNFGLTGTDTTTITIHRTDPPVALLELTNHLSGISLALGGTNGADWAVERTFHEEENADQVIYLRSDVVLSLAHNAHNTTLDRSGGIPHPIGIGGLDGNPATDDAGDIHWKIDRDMQSHGYTTVGASIPAYAPLYDGPFSFDTLTYDGVTPVLGAIGDNGLAWGGSPTNTSARFAYGQLDRFGNEWHTLTYWDNDGPVFAAAGVNPDRIAASDGHWVYVCVDPVTPVLQFTAPAGQQYYTTPLKTYHIPRTWDQTTYLTPGVQIAFVNLTNDARVQYRVDGGPWQEFRGGALTASDLFTTANGPSLLEVRAGDAATILERTIVMSPDYPAPDEEHGTLLWADEDERLAIADKVHTLQPFKVSYEAFLNSYYQGSTANYTDVRGGWRSGAGLASSSLANAFAAAIEGPAAQPNLAALAKQRLIRMARLEPVGFDHNVSFATPSKDYLNELGQTIQQFADAGVAYDLLASCYRRSDHPAGMTPIEEIRIRDGLAEIAKSILQTRANWSFTVGGGDTHWAHGYELAFGIIAAAMPTYATPWFGVSGGDRTTVNDLEEGGYYWNPFPDQGVTWWEAATDPAIATPGHPNVKAPLRAEALMTDEGWWTGPNDYQGDGDRYFDGVSRSQLVDLNSGGMANAECRVELVEMSGYESPFSERLHVLDGIRRLRGDDARQPSVTNYIRRRLVHGYTPLSWNAATKVYTAGAPRCGGSLLAYNNRYEAASLPSATAIMGTFLSDLRKYYGYEPGEPTMDMEQSRKTLYDAYTLALMWDPTQIAPHQAEPNHAPILKPLLKHVVHPGEALHKDLIAMDPDDDPLTITVTGLPAAAVYDPAARSIDWMPSAADAGVHVATVTVSDGAATTVGHWPMIVKADAPSGPIPANVTGATATLEGDDITVSWTEPSGVSISHIIVWRDGIPAVVLPSGTTSWVDADRPGGTHTRYHVSVLSTVGAESSGVVASPGYLFIPFAQAAPGDADGDGDVDLDDFVILKNNFGTPSGATQATGDFDGDGDVDLDDFVILKTNFGR